MTLANSIPKPTTGSHFSDYLICPQRAWLQYYGNSKDQVKDPAYLLALQRKGLDYERFIYEKHFPNATKIPSIKDTKKRHKMTISAMKKGEPVILQAYLAEGDRVGVIDFLERIESNQKSNSDYTYRVGEIKSSVSLATAHVMQAAWYNDLVKRFQGLSVQEARFFIKSEKEKKIDLSVIKDDYNKVCNDLLNLRESTMPPGPFLIKACSSCRWRSVCMAELIANKHLSLVPHMSRQYSAQLNTHKIYSWDDLNCVNASILGVIGFNNFEIELIIKAVKCLNNDWPPPRYPLKKDLLDDLCVVVAEIPDLATQRKLGAGLIATALWFEGQNKKPVKISVKLRNNIMVADMTPIAKYKRIAFYGSTDLGIFRQVASHNQYKLQENVDIFEIVDNILHIPAPGTELDALFGYITATNNNLLDVKKRLEAIREVINWVAKSI